VNFGGRSKFITTLSKSTTARQQSVIKARLKLLTQKKILCKINLQICDGNEWQQQSYYESEDHPATEDVKFIRKIKFPAKILLWLAVSKSSMSDPVFFKAGLAVNKEVYISKCLPVLQKLIQKHRVLA
jgi:hypothetical protein